MQGDVLLAHTAGNSQRVGLLPIFCAVKDKNKNIEADSMAMRRGRTARTRTYYADVRDVPMAQPAYATQGFVERRTRVAQRVPRPLARAPPPAATYARGSETKAVDTPPTVADFLTVGAVGAVPLNVPISGAAFYQRVGNKIAMKSLQIRGFIYPGGANAAAVNEQIARIIIFYDRQTNGAAPAVADVLLGTKQDGTTETSATSPINMNNRDRFYILADMQVALPAVGINGATAASTATIGIDINGNAGDANQGQFNMNRFIKLKGLEAQYKGNNGNAGDVAAGGIFVLCISSGDGNASSAWKFAYNARLRYNDY